VPLKRHINESRETINKRCGQIITGFLVENMGTETHVLSGKYVRLEPLDHRHVDGLVAASAGDASLYQWSPVPRSQAEAVKYVDTAMAWRDAQTAVPFATVRIDDGTVIGSTRFWNLERWSWPPGHARQGRHEPDACEIGYTWLSHAAVRTAANTEAKLLMLAHAFETWQVLRVCFHTDARNQRSRAALERIGGKFEGILRSHRIAADYTARDSVRYSIVASEWPSVKERLSHLLHQA
jgi:RimJ/RimL family protein N-acetyltransferase